MPDGPSIGESVRIAVDPDPNAFHLFDASSGVRLGSVVTDRRCRVRRG